MRKVSPGNLTNDSHRTLIMRIDDFDPIIHIIFKDKKYLIDNYTRMGLSSDEIRDSLYEVH